MHKLCEICVCVCLAQVLPGLPTLAMISQRKWQRHWRGSGRENILYMDAAIHSTQGTCSSTHSLTHSFSHSLIHSQLNPLNPIWVAHTLTSSVPPLPPTPPPPPPSKGVRSLSDDWRTNRTNRCQPIRFPHSHSHFHPLRYDPIPIRSDPIPIVVFVLLGIALCSSEKWKKEMGDWKWQRSLKHNRTTTTTTAVQFVSQCIAISLCSTYSTIDRYIDTNCIG